MEKKKSGTGREEKSARRGKWNTKGTNGTRKKAEKKDPSYIVVGKNKSRCFK